MKAGTKAQKEALQLSAKLTDLTKAERVWALKYVPYFIGHESRGTVTCMHCGHTFSHNGKETQRCPHCRRTLHIRETRKESDRDVECFVLMDAIDRWQVMRYFHVVIDCTKSGKQGKTRISEIMQRWVSTSGDYVIIAKQRNICFYNISWAYDSEMQVRQIPDKYYYNGIDREGFCEMRVRRWHERLLHVSYDKGQTKLDVFTYIRAMMSSTYAETLFKMGRLELFAVCAERNLFRNSEIVAAMRIALRNKFDIEKDATLWLDYVETLYKLKKDLHSPAYVCPKDLHSAHDLYLQRWRRIEAEKQRRLDQKRMLEKIMRAKKQNEAYIKRMKKFFGLQLTDGDITIHVLKDIEEFAAEASVMEHCVFQNEYYNHPQSLIMSAQVNGKRTETVEVSLSSFTISQSRGHKNMPSKYHKRIVSLVNNSMPLIKQAAGTV